MLLAAARFFPWSQHPAANCGHQMAADAGRLDGRRQANLRYRCLPVARSPTPRILLAEKVNAMTTKVDTAVLQAEAAGLKKSRHKTREVAVGDKVVGGDNPIWVQSMT